MANKTISARQRQKYDTSTNWASKNPILLAGELGIESDTKKMKVGDGSTAWNNLDYISTDTPDNMVTTNTAQDITGQKTFIGKEIIIEQTEGYRGFRVNNTDVTRGQVTESSTGAGRLIFYDKDNNILGYVQQIILKDGTSQLQLFADGNTNNANLYLNAKPDGTTEVYTDDTIRVTRGSTRNLDANNGAVPINLDRAGGSYNMLARMKSTNGVFLIGTYQNRFMITYTSNETIEAGTNAVDKQWWFNEDGSIVSTTGSLGLSSNRWQNIYLNNLYLYGGQNIYSSNIDVKTTPSSYLYKFFDFIDKNNTRIGIIGVQQSSSGKYGTYLQAGNFATMGIRGTSASDVETWVPTPPTNDNSTKIATTRWVNTAINNAISSSGGIITLTTNTNMWELDAGLYLVNQNVRLYYNLSEYITLSSNGILQITEDSTTKIFNINFSSGNSYYSYIGIADSENGTLSMPIQYTDYGIYGITPNTYENNRMLTTIEWVNNKLSTDILVPNGSYETYTVTSSGQRLIAPANGWFCARGTTDNNDNYKSITFSNETNGMVIRESGYGGGAIISAIIPVKKGDIVRFEYSRLQAWASSEYHYLRFYYGGGIE